jgi:hypothetical protein
VELSASDSDRAPLPMAYYGASVVSAIRLRIDFRCWPITTFRCATEFGRFSNRPFWVRSVASSMLESTPSPTIGRRCFSIILSATARST